MASSMRCATLVRISLSYSEIQREKSRYNIVFYSAIEDSPYVLYCRRKIDNKLEDRSRPAPGSEGY